MAGLTESDEYGIKHRYVRNHQPPLILYAVDIQLDDGVENKSSIFRDGRTYSTCWSWEEWK